MISLEAGVAVVIMLTVAFTATVSGSPPSTEPGTTAPPVTEPPVGDAPTTTIAASTTVEPSSTIPLPAAMFSATAWCRGGDAHVTVTTNLEVHMWGADFFVHNVSSGSLTPVVWQFWFGETNPYTDEARGRGIVSEGATLVMNFSATNSTIDSRGGTTVTTPSCTDPSAPAAVPAESAPAAVLAESAPTALPATR